MLQSAGPTVSVIMAVVSCGFEAEVKPMAKEVDDCRAAGWT
ncbi:MAG: hypothetical protein ACTFAL_00220 [Candidatus Electronema sp. V4]